MLLWKCIISYLFYHIFEYIAIEKSKTPAKMRAFYGFISVYYSYGFDRKH